MFCVTAAATKNGLLNHPHLIAGKRIYPGLLQSLNEREEEEPFKLLKEKKNTKRPCVCV
jgi:hypothetical protein